MFLNPSQKKAVESESPLIAVIAAAGSGKTMVLIERIYDLVRNHIVNTSAIKPVTFTRKAAGELKHRLEALQITGVKADTFHSFCFSLINGYATRLGYRHPVNAYDEYLSSTILVDILISRNLPNKTNPAKNEALRTASLKSIRGAIEKVFRENPDQWIEVDEEYQKRLRTYNAVDYSRMITETIRLLKQNPDVRDEIRRQWRHFLVDEFQDTDLEQMELLDLIGPENLFVIGDADQSIYAFRGAHPENINEIITRPGCELIHLDTNYRCCRSVIDHSNALIERNANEIRIPARPTDDAEDGICRVQYYSADSYLGTAYLVRELSREYALRDIAVLCRDNGREHYPVGCYGVCEGLKTLGIPFKRITRDNNFWESAHVRSIIYTVNLVMNTGDRASWSFAIDFPYRRLGAKERIAIKKAAIYGRTSMLEACMGINEELDLWTSRILALNAKYQSDADNAVEFFSEIVQEMRWEPYFYNLIGRSFRFLIERMKLQMRTLAQDGFPTLRDFIEWWLSREAVNEMPTINAVEVSTIHSYKGLEKPVVIIPGLTAGQFPKTSKAELDIAEEIRVLYVGITRAEQRCYVLYHEEPSPFIEYAGLFDVPDNREEEEDYLVMECGINEKTTEY